MGDLLKLVLDSIEYLWPFVIIHQWERGVVYIFGRYWRTVKPGLYPRLPFFTSIIAVPVVPESKNALTQTITALNGDTITFAIVHELEVIDAALAHNMVMEYEDKAHLDTLAAVAETLSTVPEGRLEPEKRRGLIRSCRTEVNKRLGTYGMRCNEIEFIVFVRNMRVFRHFGSMA